MADELFAYTLEAVGTRLTEDQQQEVLKRLAGYQPTGWEKIKAVIAELLAKLRALVGRVQEVDGLYQTVLQFADRMQEVAKKSQERKKNPANTVENTADAGGKEKTAEGGGERYSINPNYWKEFDTWVANGKPQRGNLTLGTTSGPLREIGIRDAKIIFDTSKINKIQKDHPNMTDKVLRNLPYLLEHPVLIMDSKTVSGRLVLLGNLKDVAGDSVLCALELNPVDGQGVFRVDTIKVASAYGKEHGIQNLINQSKIRWMTPNKNRINAWLVRNRLQLPFNQYDIDSNNSISENGEKVKTQNSEKTVTRNSEAGMAERISKKAEQLRIIEATNPAPDSYHTWIREESDIMTLAEAYDDQIARGEFEPDEALTPDWSAQDVLDAIESGYVTVYSSYPIKNGVFVTPSRMEAESYSGDGKVYQKRVPISDVAWIDVTQGQYAKVSTSAAKYENTADADGTVRYSRKISFGQAVRMLDPRNQSEEGEKFRYNYVKVGNTPKFYEQFGFDTDLPLLISTNHVVDIMTPFDAYHDNAHGMTPQDLIRVSNSIQNPIMVFRSPSSEIALIVVTDVPAKAYRIKKKPNGQKVFQTERTVSITAILSPFQIGQKEGPYKGLKINLINSAYGRHNLENYIGNAIENKQILFYDKKKRSRLYSRITADREKTLNAMGDSDFKETRARYRDDLHDCIIAQRAQKNKTQNSEISVKRSSDAGIAAQIAASAETRKAVEGLADTVKGLTDGEIKRHVMQGLVALEKEYNVDRGTDTADLYDRMEALLRQMRDDAAAGTYDTEAVLQTVAELTDEFLSDLARRENPNVTGFAAKVKGMRFGLDEKQAAEVAYVFGSLKEARQALFPFCYLTTKGKMKIDAQYDFLREQFPDLPEWTGAAEALTVIRDRIKEEAYYVPWKALSDTDYESAAARMLDGMVRGNPETARTAMNRLIRSGRGAVEELELQRMSEELKQKKKLLRQADASEHGDLARRIMAAQIRDKLNIMARPVTNRNPVPENLRKLNDAVVAAFVNREGFADAERKKNELYFDILIRIWYRKIAFLKMVQKCKQCDKRLVK